MTREILPCYAATTSTYAGRENLHWALPDHVDSWHCSPPCTLHRCNVGQFTLNLRQLVLVAKGNYYPHRVTMISVIGLLHSFPTPLTSLHLVTSEPYQNTSQAIILRMFLWRILPTTSRLRPGTCYEHYLPTHVFWSDRLALRVCFHKQSLDLVSLTFHPLTVEFSGHSNIFVIANQLTILVRSANFQRWFLQTKSKFGLSNLLPSHSNIFMSFRPLA